MTVQHLAKVIDDLGIEVEDLSIDGAEGPDADAHAFATLSAFGSVLRHWARVLQTLPTEQLG